MTTQSPTPMRPRRRSGDAPDGDALRLTIASDDAQATSVRHTACAFAEHHRVARPADVALAVGEAVANVVVHAYRDRAPGPLHLSGFIDPELVYLTVADDGSGLQPRPDSPGLGLGLPIIARVSDHFQFSDRAPTGTLVTMGFQRTIAPDPAADIAAENALLGQTRDQLAAAIHDGAGLDTVEARIDRAPHSTDDRHALWLYAWATIELAQRRSCAQDLRAP